MPPDTAQNDPGPATKPKAQAKATEPENKAVVALIGAIEDITSLHDEIMKDLGDDRHFAEDRLIEIVRPILTGRDIVLFWRATTMIPPDAYGNTHVEIEARIIHKSGDHTDPIRVWGCGNDRAGKQGCGDKGMLRAITAARKTALCLIFNLPIGHNPEDYDCAHDAAAAPTQGAAGGKASGKASKEYLSMADEDAFEKDLINWVGACRTQGELKALMDRDDVVKDLAKCRDRIKDKLTTMARERYPKLARASNPEVTSGRRDNGDDARSARNREDDDRRGGQRENEGGSPGYDIDDDIPF